MVETSILEDVQSSLAPVTKSDVTSRKISIDDVPKRFTRRFTLMSESAVSAEVARLEQAITAARESLSSKEASLLPLEEQHLLRLRLATNRTVARLRNAIERVQQQGKSYPFDEQFARIDMTFLEMQNWSEQHKCAVPLFAVFTPSDPVCTLSVRAYSGDVAKRSFTTDMYCPIPELSGFFDMTGLRQLAIDLACQAALASKSPDVRTRSSFSPMFRDSQRRCNATLTARTKFAGVIPDDARNVIHDCSGRFDAIYIVAETPAWTITVETEVTPPQPIPVGDPLIIGRKGSCYWLLTKFDTTASEDYAAHNFTAGAKK